MPSPLSEAKEHVTALLRERHAFALDMNLIKYLGCQRFPIFSLVRNCIHERKLSMV